MRIPLTKFGLPQVLIYPLLVFVLMFALFIIFKPAKWLIPSEFALFLVLVWMLSFFRDPQRNIVPDEMILYSPADGTITDIVEVDGSVLGMDSDPSVASGKALRIGMFLSIFNVHINRVPSSVRIEKVSYKKGKFINAMSGEATKVNESNDILMTRLSEPKDRLLVRQISGAIARHIVCEAAPDREYRQGEAFGMIKFGSRTELYIPESDEKKYEVSVKIGDTVRAGLTPFIRYL